MSTPENIRIAETFPLLSVVVPVYEEEANISPFLKRLIPVMDKITSEYEVIFSMDHSTDGTEKTIVEHLERNPKI
jgi:glycosyltransferase involved in cell wall biosynthesis